MKMTYRYDTNILFIKIVKKQARKIFTMNGIYIQQKK